MFVVYAYNNQHHIRQKINIILWLWFLSVTISLVRRQQIYVSGLRSINEINLLFGGTNESVIGLRYSQIKIHYHAHLICLLHSSALALKFTKSHSNKAHTTTNEC